jgi:hypothetical protein
MELMKPDETDFDYYHKAINALSATLDRHKKDLVGHVRASRVMWLEVNVSGGYRIRWAPEEVAYTLWTNMALRSPQYTTRLPEPYGGLRVPEWATGGRPGSD